MVLTGVVSVGCVLAVLQLNGATHLRAGDGAGFRPLLAAAILGLVNAGIGNIIYYSLIRSWGVTRTALVSYVVPLIGVTLGVVLLHDRLAPNMVVGLVLISASLACLGPPREPEPGLT
jgi:drug/metabolite transporter (DMT)-like permease